MSKWFMPTGETAAKIQAIIKEAEAVKQRGIKLMDRVGASGVRTYERNYKIEGFAFKADPDPKFWKKSRRCGWLPKKTTNAAVLEEMEQCQHATYNKIANLIGFNLMNIVGDEYRNYVEQFGWDFTTDGRMILEMPDRFDEVTGCERISDVEAEQLAKKPKRKKQPA